MLEIQFETFITFESFSTLTSSLEFNIDVAFVNYQVIQKSYEGFVYELVYKNHIIPIQIQGFANLQVQKENRDIKLLKDFKKLKEMKLNQKENSIMAYL